MSLVDLNLLSRIKKTLFIGIFWLTFIILFLAFNPIGLNLFQSIAIFLSSGIIAVGLLALMWVAWAVGE